jgi:TonB family protein
MSLVVSIARDEPLCIKASADAAAAWQRGEKGFGFRESGSIEYGRGGRLEIILNVAVRPNGKFAEFAEFPLSLEAFGDLTDDAAPVGVFAVKQGKVTIAIMVPSLEDELEANVDKAIELDRVVLAKGTDAHVRMIVSAKISSAAKATAGGRPDEGVLLVQADVDVVVQGASHVSGAADGGARRVSQPFVEQTSTAIVFAHGAVVRLSEIVTPGQILILRHGDSHEEAACRVVNVKASGTAESYVEVEFLQPAPGFWGAALESPNGSKPLSAPAPRSRPVSEIHKAPAAMKKVPPTPAEAPNPPPPEITRSAPAAVARHVFSKLLEVPAAIGEALARARPKVADSETHSASVAPVVAQAAPVAEELSPAVVDDAPVAADPAEVAAEFEPVTAAPAPDVVESSRVITEPVIEAAEPAPVVTLPAPVEVEPAHAIVEPVSVAPEVEPAVPAPAPEDVEAAPVAAETATIAREIVPAEAVPEPDLLEAAPVTAEPAEIIAEAAPVVAEVAPEVFEDVHLASPPAEIAAEPASILADHEPIAAKPEEIIAEAAPVVAALAPEVLESASVTADPAPVLAEAEPAPPTETRPAPASESVIATTEKAQPTSVEELRRAVAPLRAKAPPKPYPVPAFKSPISTPRPAAAEAAGEVLGGDKAYAWSKESTSRKSRVGSIAVAAAVILGLGAGAGFYHWQQVSRSEANVAAATQTATLDPNSAADANTTDSGAPATAAAPSAGYSAQPPTARTKTKTPGGGTQPAASAPQSVAPAEDTPQFVEGPEVAEMRMSKPTAAAHSTNQAAPSIAADVPSAAEGASAGGILSDSDSGGPAAPPTRTSTGAQQPRLLSAPEAVYPYGARAEHVQGDVAVDILINEAGNVTTMTVISGPTLLRSAALDALRRRKYAPAMLDGKPIPAHVVVITHFQL